MKTLTTKITIVLNKDKNALYTGRTIKKPSEWTDVEAYKVKPGDTSLLPKMFIFPISHTTNCPVQGNQTSLKWSGYPEPVPGKMNLAPFF